MALNTTHKLRDTMTERSTIYLSRLHWIIFFWPVVLFIVTLYLATRYPEFKEPSLVFAGAALIWIFMTWVRYFFSSLTIKQNQVILRTGIIIRQTIDIPINKIESIDIRQSIIGSIFRYGSVVITGTGGTKHLITYLHRPLTCRRYIEQQMHGGDLS